MKNFFNDFRNANRDMSMAAKILIAVLVLSFFGRGFQRIFNLNTIFMIIVLIFSLIIHEVAHGVAAYLSGDTTAKREGRLSLNPISHLDPMGTLFPVLMLLAGSSFIIGWAKPVPVNYRKLKHGRYSEFFVAIAGVTANFLMALAAAFIIKYCSQFLYETGTFKIANYAVLINLALMIFNLIPIPPLDGSRVLASIGNRDLREGIAHMEKYGMIIVIILAYTGILGNFMNPIIGAMIKFLNWIILL